MDFQLNKEISAGIYNIVSNTVNGILYNNMLNTVMTNSNKILSINSKIINSNNQEANITINSQYIDYNNKQNVSNNSFYNFESSGIISNKIDNNIFIYNPFILKLDSNKFYYSDIISYSILYKDTYIYNTDVSALNFIQGKSKTVSLLYKDNNIIINDLNSFYGTLNINQYYINGIKNSLGKFQIKNSSNINVLINNNLFDRNIYKIFKYTKF